MRFPFTERTSPREIAEATAMSGHFHEVVISASKVLHGRELDTQDQGALEWANELLEIAASADVMLAMPSAQQLAGPGNAAIAVRNAARPDGGDPDETLNVLRSGLQEAIRGRRNDAVISAMDTLREVFSAVSRLSLQAEVVAQREEGSEKPWALSPTSSRS
jgi:hypothetical protein